MKVVLTLYDVQNAPTNFINRYSLSETAINSETSESDFSIAFYDRIVYFSYNKRWVRLVEIIGKPNIYKIINSNFNSVISSIAEKYNITNTSFSSIPEESREGMLGTIGVKDNVVYIFNKVNGKYAWNKLVKYSIDDMSEDTTLPPSNQEEEEEEEVIFTKSQIQIIISETLSESNLLALDYKNLSNYTKRIQDCIEELDSEFE